MYVNIQSNLFIPSATSNLKEKFSHHKVLISLILSDSAIPIEKIILILVLQKTTILKKKTDNRQKITTKKRQTTKKRHLFDN